MLRLSFQNILQYILGNLYFSLGILFKLRHSIEFKKLLLVESNFAPVPDPKKIQNVNLLLQVDISVNWHL